MYLAWKSYRERKRNRRESMTTTGGMLMVISYWEDLLLADQRKRLPNRYWRSEVHLVM